MYWLAVAFGIALLATLLTGGSLARLMRLPIQSWWLLVLGLGGQIALWLVEVPDDRVDDLGFGLLMATYAFLLAFCFVNIRVLGIPIVTLGVAMNAVVTGLNEGMPTRDREVQTVTERPERDTDMLPFLGQIVRLPDNPVADVLAPGDLVIAAGLVVVFVGGSRRRRREPEPAEAPDAAPSEAAAVVEAAVVEAEEPAPARPRTAAEEWAEWRAELHQVASELDDPPGTGPDEAR